jgi:hypothetical protein
VESKEREVVEPNQYLMDVEKSIWASNLQTLKRKLLFDKSYMEFLLNLSQALNLKGEQKYLSPKQFVEEPHNSLTLLQSTQAFTLHIFDVVIRSSKPGKILSSWITMLKKNLSEDVPSACWLLKFVANSSLLIDVLIHCQSEDVRKAVKSFFEQACLTLCPFELGTSSALPEEEKKGPTFQDADYFDSKVKETFADGKIEGKSLTSKLNELKGIGAKNLRDLESLKIQTIKQMAEVSDLQTNQIKLKFSNKEMETLNQRVFDAVELISFFESEAKRNSEASLEKSSSPEDLKVNLSGEKGFLELFLQELSKVISSMPGLKIRHSCNELFDLIGMFASKGYQERRLLVDSGVLQAVIGIIDPSSRDSGDEKKEASSFSGDTSAILSVFRGILKGCSFGGGRTPMSYEGDLVELQPDFCSRLTSESFLRCLLRLQTTKIDELSSLIAILCFENLPASKVIFDYVVTQVTEMDFDGFYPSLKIAHSLLNLTDSINGEKVDYFLPLFLNVTQINQQFWKATDLLAHMLVRYCKSNPKVQQWVVKNKASVGWLLDWLKKYATEPGRYAANGPTKYKIDIPDPDKKQNAVDQARDNSVDLKRKKGDTHKDLQSIVEAKQS